jgi:tetratricopeptide (TPR) repeat protein
VRHHQAGQLAEADRLYGAVLAAEPSHAHALHLRGALAHAVGRHQDAVDLIARALARDEQPDFHHNIGLALSALGRRRDAADHWARAVAINPNHAAARLNLGNVLHEARACRRRGAAGARMARSRDQPVGAAGARAARGGGAARHNPATHADRGRNITSGPGTI